MTLVNRHFGPQFLAAKKCSRLDLYKTRRYIHAMFWIVSRKLQQQCRFKGGICMCAFRD
jgi:hypothetical protein